MKQKKTFRYCEYCDKAWEDVPLPTEEEYKSGMVKIEEERGMTVLLPKPVGEAHCLFVSGVFCDIYHLVSYIQEKSNGGKAKNTKLKP